MLLELPGNLHVKKYLENLLQSGNVPNSLLFSGPKGAGKRLCAEKFAKLLLKTGENHPPDLHLFAPEGKIAMHSIDSMRQMAQEVYLPPYISERKVFIIEEAERMLPSSSNALLKTFEEPAPHSIIILISSAPELLLPTVLSRCQTVRFELGIEEVVKKEHLSEKRAQLRMKMFQFLSDDCHYSYTHIMPFVKEVALRLEQEQKQVERSMHAEMEQKYLEGTSSAQQQAIDKEADGAAFMAFLTEAQYVFDLIISWYRDMHLLHVGGDRKYLLNPDYEEAIQQALQRGMLVSLEKVHAAIGKARLGLERSTSVAICLEDIFLTLSH